MKIPSMPLVLGLTLLFAGCVPKPKPVEVDYNRISIEEMSHGVVELKMFNPNPFSLDIENLDYVLLLGTDTLALGHRPEPVSIRKQDTTLAEFPFTVAVTVPELLDGMPGILEDTLRLRLAGDYRLPTMFGTRHAPFRYTRIIPLQDELRGILRPFEDILDLDDWFRRQD